MLSSTASNFFDTANVYGWQQGEGITEQIVGRWFAQGGGRREETVLATKLYGSLRAVQIRLNEDALTWLDEIFPGPGGTAPEA